MTIKVSGNMMEIPIEKPEKEIMLQFVEVLKTNPNHAYDFIGNNYWKMSKEELTNIIKELLYNVEEYSLKGDFKKMMEYTSEELEELYKEEN